MSVDSYRKFDSVEEFDIFGDDIWSQSIMNCMDINGMSSRLSKTSS